MQGFLRTPWNATSRTTAQDALWQHILYRNTSSQPFIIPCARQVMNRIPGNVTPPWAGCWGPLHSCSVSRARYLEAYQHREIDNQQGRPPRPKPPPHPGKATPCPVLLWPALWNHLHIEDSCGFQWRDVDAATREFPQDLHNTRSRVLSPPQRIFKKNSNYFLCCWISISLAIFSEILIQIGYFFLRVMQENKSGCLFLNTAYFRSK